MTLLPGSPARAWKGALAALLALAMGCQGDGPASLGGLRPAALSLSVSLQAAAAGGEAQAYDACDSLHIVLVPAVALDQTVALQSLFDETVAFQPQAVNEVPVTVKIQGETAAFLNFTLLRGSDPLFTGGDTVTLVPNSVAAVADTLFPVAAAISVPDTLPPLSSIGEVRKLPGEVLFATGDVATSLTLGWTSLTPQVVAVRTGTTGDSVVALAPGDGQLQAFYGPLSQVVQAPVRLVVASVQITPSTSVIQAKRAVRLSAAALDSLGNPIGGLATTWSTQDNTLVFVDTTGLVTGLAPGTATVSATMGGTAGQAVVRVIAPPVGTVLGPSPVTESSATLHGTVNPQADSTTAWFEWGTDSLFTTYTSTPAQQVGTGTTVQQVQASITGLSPDVTYYVRTAATNAAGTTRSAPLTFQSAPRAPSGLNGSFDGPLYMNWTDNSTTETFFRVDEATSPSGPFDSVTTAPANSPSASEPAPFPAQVVYHEVVACNAWGCSAPSNVLTNVVPKPSISGTLWLCYSAGTSNCSDLYLNGDTVKLTGPVDSSVISGPYGYSGYYFDSLPVGTYTVQVADTICGSGAAFRTPSQTVTVGWGEAPTIDFYADTVTCALPIASNTHGFDPAVAAFLGIDTDTRTTSLPPPPR